MLFFAGQKLIIEVHANILNTEDINADYTFQETTAGALESVRVSVRAIVVIRR